MSSSGIWRLASLLVALSASAEGQGPPREPGPFRRVDLVELPLLDPTIRLDVRYATSQNFVGKPVYKEGRVFLERDVALALVRVGAALRPRGFGLLVFDGYRPWSVTKLFWDTVPKDKRRFVADPKKGSRHNRGAAVDLTLCSLDSGREVEMPSSYDEMSERASPGYRGGSQQARDLRDLLRFEMAKEHFTVDKNEWWHFDHHDWKEYPILDIPFETIASSGPH